jgi:hypothetical protein
MQKRLHGCTLALALAALTFVPVVGFAANPAPAATPNPPQTNPGPTTQEKHPVMRRAINQTGEGSWGTAKRRFPRF